MLCHAVRRNKPYCIPFLWILEFIFIEAWQSNFPLHLNKAPFFSKCFIHILLSHLSILPGLEADQFSSVQLLNVSNSLQRYGLKHARLPSPSPTHGACSNSCPSSRWCHPTVSSSVVPFSLCLQSLPASGSFPMSQFFTSGGQKYWSFSFSIRPSNEYSELMSFRIDWFDLLAVQGTLKSSPTPQLKSTNTLRLSFLYAATL